MSSSDLQQLSKEEARAVLLSGLSSVGLTLATLLAIFRSHTMTRGGKQSARALNLTQLEQRIEQACSKKLISHAVYRRILTTTCTSNRNKFAQGKAVFTP